MFKPIPMPKLSPDSNSVGKFECLVCGNSLKILAVGDWARDQTFFRPFIKPASNLNGGARSLNQQGFGLAAATRVGQKDGYNYLFRRHFILPELVGRDKKLMEVGAVVRVPLTVAHCGTVWYFEV